MSERCRDDLNDIYDRLGAQEREVLHDIAERLEAGQANYGRIKVETDERDYFQEAAEEAMDFVVYHAMQRLRDKQ